MNEMKAEDVMKALDLFHQRILETKLAEKIYEQEIMAIIYAKYLILKHQAKAREKDALIAELTQTNAKNTELIEELQLGWSEDQERVRKILDAKDEEIERLIKERDEARRDVGRAEKNHYESEKEVERLRHICRSYALRYGTVRDQREAIKEIRDEAVKEFTEKVSKASVVFTDAEDCMVLATDVEKVFQIASEMKYPPLPKCSDQIAKEMKVTPV